jgi:hypothetical protein
MGTPQDHRKCAEQGPLTLAQSWVQLAERAARAPGDRSATLPTAMTFSPSTRPIEPGVGRCERRALMRSLTAGDCRALGGTRR